MTSSEVTVRERERDDPGLVSRRPKSPRVYFIDILRIIASVQMINGHTLDAVMFDSIKSGPIYENYSWARGLVSVAFLFVAGMAFHLATFSFFAKPKIDRAAVKRRLRRVGTIVLIAYAMTLPWGLFSADEETKKNALFYFYRVEILRCIGVGLLSLQLMGMFWRNRNAVAIMATTLGVASFLSAPFLDLVISDGEPHPLWNWVSHRGGSMFPLTPWCAYLFFGFAIGVAILPDGGRTPLKRTLPRLMIVCVALTVCWLIARTFDWEAILPKDTGNRVHPLKGLERMAVVSWVLAVLAIICAPLTRLPKFFAILSAETLTIYVFHLVVLFYPFVGIVGHIGKNSLPLRSAAWVSAGMMVLTLGFVLVWHEGKKRVAEWRSRPPLAR